MEINMNDYVLKSSFNLLLIALEETNDKLREYWWYHGNIINGVYDNEPNILETQDLMSNNNHILWTFAPENITPALSLEA